MFLDILLVIIITILVAGALGVVGGAVASSSNCRDCDTFTTVSFAGAGIVIFVGLIRTIANIVIFNVFLSFKRILQEGNNGDIEMK